MMMPLVCAEYGESTVNSNAFKHIMDRFSNISNTNRSIKQTDNIAMNLSGDVVQENFTNNNMMMAHSELKRAMTPTSTHLQPLASISATGKPGQPLSNTPVNKNLAEGFSTLQVPNYQNTFIIHQNSFENQAMPRMGLSFKISNRDDLQCQPMMSYLVPDPKNMDEGSQISGLNPVTLAIPDLPA